MSKPSKSTVVADSLKHAVKQLQAVAPEAAMAFDANPPPQVIAGSKAATVKSPPGGLLTVSGSPGVSHPAQKGVVLQPEQFNLPEFRNGLGRAIKAVGFDPADQGTLASLGVTSFDDFLKVTKRALTVDPNHAVTPEKAVGNYFEIVGWDHPVGKMLWLRTFAGYRDKVHTLADAGGTFRDGLFEPVTIRSPFHGPVLVMENPRIIATRSGTELDGGQYVDRIAYVTNKHSQTIGIFGDLKGVSAAKGLKKQVTTRDPRLLAAMALDGAEPAIVGQVNGQPTVLPLKQFLFPDDADAAALSRIGVRATKGETRYEVEIAKDQHGDPYVRMVLHCRTDIVWRIYTAFYREMGY